MPNRVPWTERKFNFDFPVDIFPELIERVRGTPARVEEIVRSIPPDILTKRKGDTWSIQENIGHLSVVESLFTGRLDDYDAGLDTLRPADMTNRKSHEANYNARAIEDVLVEFRSVRAAMVGRVESLPPEDFARVAMHPRLQKPMRVTDMLFFQAEHDDYHLARIRTLIRTFT